MEVGRKADGKAHDHGDCHVLSKVLDDLGEAVDTREVQPGADDQRGVEGGKGVALVHQRLVVERGDGKAFLPVAWHDDGQCELKDHQAAVADPRALRGVGVL